MSCISFDASGSGEEDKEAWQQILGIALGLSASIGINVGNNIQAVGLQMQAQEGKEGKNKTFWIGCSIFAVASVVNFGAFGFAPASVLAPLEGIQFVTNLAFARLVNKKTVTFRMVFGSALIVLGVVLAIVASPSGVAQFSAADLKCFWTSAVWLIYLTVLAGSAIFLQMLHIYYQRELNSGRPKPNHQIVLPVTFALTSAIAGSQAVVQAKSMSELVELVFTDLGVVGLLKEWFFYFCLVLLLVFLMIWLTRLSSALGKYDPLFIIPMLQSNYILFSTITGGIYFQEFNQLSITGAAMFSAGVAVMFVGLYLLAPTGGEQHESVYLEAASKAKDQVNQSFARLPSVYEPPPPSSDAKVAPHGLLKGNTVSDAPERVSGRISGRFSTARTSEARQSRALSLQRAAADAAGHAARVHTASTSVVTAPDEAGVVWPVPLPVLIGSEIAKSMSFRAGTRATHESSVENARLSGRFHSFPASPEPSYSTPGRPPPANPSRFQSFPAGLLGKGAPKRDRQLTGSVVLEAGESGKLPDIKSASEKSNDLLSERI